MSLVVASSSAVQRFDLSILRFLEGYGKLWVNPLRLLCIERYCQHKALLLQKSNGLRQIQSNNEVKLQCLKEKIDTQGADVLTDEEKDVYRELHIRTLSRSQQEHLIGLRRELRELPRLADIMPTKLGNVLRVAECKPSEKYGLDAVVCWSRLWLLLPDTAKKDLKSTRDELNSAVRLWLWSVLFTIWFFFGAWWAVPIGIISACFAYYCWAIPAARSYGALVEAVFDLYRHLLYQSLRWNLPSEPSVERRVGNELTLYLLQGL